MRIYLEVLAILILSGTFVFYHSALASEKVLEKVKVNAGERYFFFRLFYIVSSAVLLGLIFYIAPDPYIILYDLRYPYDIILTVIQVLALAGIIWTFISIDLLDFMGLKQFLYSLGDEEDPDEEEEKTPKLWAKGPYKFMRHPLYVFLIIFFFSRSYMDLQVFTFSVCGTIYLIFGARSEEKKLLNKFGNEYKDYMSKVPGFFPVKFKRG